MFDRRGFWLSQMLALILFYVAAISFCLSGQAAHLVVKIAAVLLAAHVLEIPVAFYMLKSRKPQALRVVIATLLFGLVWWIPARRGVVAIH